jgi:hypothetical protein
MFNYANVMNATAEGSLLPVLFGLLFVILICHVRAIQATLAIAVVHDLVALITLPGLPRVVRLLPCTA